MIEIGSHVRVQVPANILIKLLNDGTNIKDIKLILNELDGRCGTVQNKTEISNLVQVAFEEMTMWLPSYCLVLLTEDEPYNAELICIESKDNTWYVGDVVEIENGTLYYRSIGTRYRYPYSKFNNIEDVNNAITTARFAEIKETIGDKAGWNGKFYVVDTTEYSSLKAGNVYVVKEGILNVGRYTYSQIFTSFEEIQEKFNDVDLIEIKECAKG